MAEQHPPKDIVPGCGEWKDNDWPPLLGPWRYGHEAVVVPAPSSLDSKEPVVAAVVVVLGGEHEDEQVFDSVQWLPLVVGGGATTTTTTTTLKPQSSWQTGPSLNTPRSQHASVLCNGAIYAMGGFNG